MILRTGDLQDTRVGTYIDRRGNEREIRIELPDPDIVRRLRLLTPEERIESGLRHSVFLRRQTRAFLESRRFLGRRAG